MEKIAIIGVGCRFPGADNPTAFWELLSNQIDAVTELSSRPYDWDALHQHSVVPTTESNSIKGGYLENVEDFDPHFFQISPKEAERLDPQQRLVLEVAWESLENAGIISKQLSGTKTGVFLGASNYDYGMILAQENAQINAYNAAGTGLCIIANRLSYLLNLQGPSLVIDTACSSSLVAVHYACQSLLNRESNLCLAGGVNLVLSPPATISLSHSQMMSKDGHCKSFDADADGYVRGEGCGVIVLKRLADAVRDGDNIQGVIAGSAVNQDGLSNGLTAPNGLAQQAVIRQALSNAEIKPAQISYVEAQGTGTPLGDSIELNALKTVLMEGREADQPCSIGSVKTNIGHLEAAGGIAGLIKVVLSLQKGQIPAHLHLKKLNPYIKIDQTPLSIPTELQEWTTTEDVRRAGVSAFGFGGTNSHIVLESAPAVVKKEKENICDRPSHILTLSAKTEPSLQELVSKYKHHLETDTDQKLADICYTANTGREHFQYRLAVVANSKEELISQLAAFTEGEQTSSLVSNKASKKQPKIAFVFTGQGSEYINMGRELYETQPIFRQTFDQCNQILRPYLEHSLLDVIYPDKTGKKIAYSQPALFAIEYALSKLWQSWGIKPKTVVGYDLGEYVAATIAGIFSLEDALKLIVEKGKLIQRLAETEKIPALVSPGVAVTSTKESQSLETTNLQITDNLKIAEFRAIANQINFHPPQIKIVSSINSKLADQEIANPEYWVNHLTDSVQCTDSIPTLDEIEDQICLQIGSSCDSWSTILSSLGQLYVAGAKVDWQEFDSNYQRQKVTLPTYAFQREKYWITTSNQKTVKSSVLLADDNDNLVAEIEQLIGKRVTRQTLLKILETIEQEEIQKSTVNPPTNILQQIETAQIGDRQNHLTVYLQQQVAKVLGFKNSQLPNPEQNFLEMGMDSLMVMELRNTVQTDLKLDIPIATLMEGVNITTLSTTLNDQILTTNISQIETSEKSDLTTVQNYDEWIEIEI
jgi:acyl transferase domain-containing protein